jgi:hypothetical protein
MFTKYMVLDLFLADGRKLGAPRKTRRNSLTGISGLKVCLTESLPLLPNRVNRWVLGFALTDGVNCVRKVREAVRESAHSLPNFFGSSAAFCGRTYVWVSPE